jgi:hypothetical protein
MVAQLISLNYRTNMKQIVIMPGGFHPFHAGHMALYNSARQAFPDADLYVAATNSQEERPFPFAVKEKLAKVAGVEPGHFIQVKSPFQAKEITQSYNPEQDVLIFVRSEKDRNESPKPGGTKKDGSPAYFQPYTGKNMQPFSKHAYFAYLPTVKFGPGITSATEIRKAWPTLDDRRKTAMVMSLYPAAQKNQKLAANIVGMLDQVMGGQEDVTEARVEINQDAPDNLYDIQDKLAVSRWKSSIKNVITSLFAKRYPGVQLFFKNTQDGNLFVTTDKTALASEDVGLYSDTDEFGASIIGPTAEYGVDDILYVGIGFDSIKSGKYKGIVGEMLNTIVPPLAAKFKAKPAIVIVVEDQSGGAWEAMANKLGWAFISGEDEQGMTEQGYGNHPSQRVDPRTGKKYVPPKSPLTQGVAEGAPIVVMPRSDRFGTKKPAQPYRNQGDIVPPTKPPSTEKRGVKGRPGQRPMPTYEGSEEKDNLIWTLNSFGYYSDNSSVYVNDDGDKIVRVGSEWKHQSGKRGRGPEELGTFLSSLQDVSEGFGLPMPGTYEQEHGTRTPSRKQHITAMTYENDMSKTSDYIEEK